MIPDTPAIAAFRARYRATLPADHPHHHAAIPADVWGDTPELIDELAALILAGTKTASCGAVWELEAEGSAAPVPGTLTIVVDGGGTPLCIVETVDLTFRRFSEIDPEFAAAEGEGDRTLASWREGHESFFSRVLPAIGRTFSDDMPLFCERFRVIFRGEAGDTHPTRDLSC